MMMHSSGTFDYTFIAADGPGSGTRRLEGTVRESRTRDDKRLLGHAPLLVTQEYQREDWQLYSLLTLTPRDQNATVQSFSFSVDRELIKMLREGDALHISRTPCAGLGLSVLRDGQLVAAAGAISDLPLGPDVSIGTPFDLVREAERIFQTREPEFQLRNCPVELRIGNVTRMIDVGRPKIGAYD